MLQLLKEIQQKKTKEGGSLLDIFVNRDRFDYSCRVIVPLLKYSG